MAATSHIFCRRELEGVSLLPQFTDKKSFQNTNNNGLSHESCGGKGKVTANAWVGWVHEIHSQWRNRAEPERHDHEKLTLAANPRPG